ncbi:MAG: hypothetical protein WBP26_00930 [Candidatus Saccharimonadales bacterium]
MQLRWFRVVTALVLSALFAAFCSVSVFAQSEPDSASTNYQVTNTFFGAGGEVEACSDSYCSRQSLGDAAVGESSSANYGIVAGSLTTQEPLLEVYVEGGNNDLGILSVDATSTATTEVSVRSYLSSGYVIQLIGTAPKINAHTINNLATPTASQTGVEQFGVNLRQNTTPVVGADVTQFPDSTFAYGTVEPNYNTPDLFAFNPGDVIAYSNSSSGRTDYMLSFIINIAPNTPAGLYATRLHALVVPTY